MKELEFVGTISKMGKIQRVIVVPKEYHKEIAPPGKQVKITIKEI